MSLETFKKIVRKSDNIVFFGGAGVSTESNIPDFRTDQGIYGDKGAFSYPPEEILSHQFFMKKPEEFYRFYKKKMIYPKAKPNLAHKALAALEKQGKLKAIITQNIDGLHQKAGNQNIFELHGSIHRNYCMKCGSFASLQDIIESPEVVPRCSCGGIFKPDVVLYQESLDTNTLQQAIFYIANADVFIVGGTSLVVYPAAGLVEYYTKDKLILINKSVTPYDNRAQLVFHENIGEILSEVV